MQSFKRALLAALFLIFFSSAFSQIDEDQNGAWYMLFWMYDIKNSPFGFQGDYQFRNWNALGDMEQLMIRNGITYRPASGDIKFTLGYARIESGAFGESKTRSGENRFYQEALIPQKLGNRFYLTHRFRYEQRDVDGQDWRTRYRYFIGLSVPFNQADLKEGAIYLALYNELFVNGQRSVGNGGTVEIFDRNRVYGGVGYSWADQSRMQLGYMHQATDTWAKNQLQIGWHQWF